MDSSNNDHNQNQTKNLKRSFDQLYAKPHVEVSPSQESLVTNLVPRRDQLEAFEIAKRRNTIAIMDTGSGKTLIAIMLIKEVGQAVRSSGVKKIIVFLAPTVVLVNQQYKNIKHNTDLQVEEYHGAKGVDTWNFESWQKEVKDNDVMVMTPQTLLDALRKAFLSIETICLIVIDECHQASGNHPYAKIMVEFYHQANVKPKIFGMTASPIGKRGVSSTLDCKYQISDLENLLDSRKYTVKDRTEMDTCIPSAKESCRYYDQARSPALSLKPKIEASWSKCDVLLSDFKSSYKDMDDKFKTLHQRMSNELAKILYCLEDLGLLCACEAAKICHQKFSKIYGECEVYRKANLQCVTVIEEVIQIIEESLHLADEMILDVEFDFSKAVDMGYISPKLFELIKLFQSFGEPSQLLCLIFVERIIAAKVIEIFVKKVSQISHLTVAYVTGSNTSADALARNRQKEIMDSFRSGKINLLFTTDVLEEGIHVPNCSCVIRFDLPTTVCSYIQSRGRSRRANSQFILMIERGNLKQRNQLFDIIKGERSMTDAAASKDNESNLRAFTVRKTEAYYVDSTGASVNLDSSVSLVNQYCEKLPRDKYSSPKPKFDLLPVEGGYQCKLILPPNAAFQTIVGSSGKDMRLAKSLVCLEACKKLHQMGALNDHLVPFVEDPAEADLKSKELSSGAVAGAGTTKRKELHGTTGIRALCGSWGDKLDGAKFYGYKFEFQCNIVHEIYSGFVLLVESKLDDDVGSMDLDLYLISKMVKTSVIPCGEVDLDAEQVAKARSFHEIFFNGLFGRLIRKSETAKGEREFLLQKDTDLLWNPKNSYLLLPLEKSNDICTGSLQIHWSAISSCSSAIEFVRRKFSLVAEDSDDTSSSAMEPESTNIFHFANAVADVSNIKDTVALAVHTGKIYCIIDVVDNSSAESPFDGNNDKSGSKITFSQYFKERYQITLKHPEQPLLRLRQGHNAHNLFLNTPEEDAGEKSSQVGPINPKAPMHVHMPPELLCLLDVKRDVLKSMYLLPSLMYRIESLMLSSQLRAEINGHPDNFKIPSSLILEALTTLRSCEKFSMERLELLGDSVLKYAVSCHLFLKYPKKHEGHLSAKRQWAVRNSTLHKLGIDRKLQGYIRDSAFEPRRWIAPGQDSIHTAPCDCGLETLEVPFDAKFITEDPQVVVGKLCDRGHRWMCSKTIADCVEALIGAYHVGGGLVASLHVMKWLGIDSELELSMVEEAIVAASLHTYKPKVNEIASLETKIGYEFSVKGLLVEATTHLSETEHGTGCCYERLEFLGDSVLDLLITWHLYQSHTEIDPGELTDLRSASVNNDSFAQAAVKHNLHPHLMHSSGLLQGQISEYVKAISESEDNTVSLPGVKAPKALGDLVESIAGAILIDTKLDLDQVWKVFNPLLSPIVTPDKLELPPLRELNQLCDSLGYFVKVKVKCDKKGFMDHVVLSVQLPNALLVRDGRGPNKKSAKGDAAYHLLKDLEKRGISYSSSKGKRVIDFSTPACQAEEQPPQPVAHKKPKLDKSNLTAKEPTSDVKQTSSDSSDCNGSVPVILSINMKKGGPRSLLYDLCKRKQWPLPSFDSTEYKDRTQFQSVEGLEGSKGTNCFVSKITLCIPDHGNIECNGEARADKKSSFDSAAVNVLYELQRLGKVKIADVSQ
ncbi:endoribonuclease Dicer homolog 3a-like [Vicia villosa]|uniref:endoribonuclease Dicer homolog 3a-like n=1 Tax=Vicia villosa TaxID=3911 RepID=UPI00273C6C49|nr:endoribonuclease Dicer homolog 3a-like [Vicia villosa]